MGSTKKPHGLGLGTPTHLILYRTPEGWRFAAYFENPGSILDGGLGDTAVSSQAGIAQSALHRNMEELTRRRLVVCWQPGDQSDWWSGIVIKAGPNSKSGG
jgi:hypothetical protein